MVLSWLLWISFALVFGQFAGSHYLVAPSVMGTGTFWFTVGLITTICLTYEMAWLVFERWFLPKNFQIAQYLQSDVKRVIRYQKKQKPLPSSLQKKTEVLEMALAVQGQDPRTAYSGYGFSGTEGARETLNMAVGGHVE